MVPLGNDVVARFERFGSQLDLVHLGERGIEPERSTGSTWISLMSHPSKRE